MAQRFAARPVQFQSALPTNRPLALKVKGPGSILGDIGEGLSAAGAIPGQIAQSDLDSTIVKLKQDIVGDDPVISDAAQRKLGDLLASTEAKERPTVAQKAPLESKEKIVKIEQEGAGERQKTGIESKEKIAAGVQTGAGERQGAGIISKEKIAAGVQTGAGARLGDTLASREKVAAEAQAGATLRQVSGDVAAGQRAELGAKTITRGQDIRATTAAAGQASATNIVMKQIESSEKNISKQIQSREDIAEDQRKLTETLQARELNYKERGLDIKEDKLEADMALGYAKIKSTEITRLEKIRSDAQQRKIQLDIMQQGTDIKRDQATTQMERARTKLEEDIIRVLRSTDSVSKQLVQLQGLQETLNKNAERLNDAAGVDIYDTNVNFTSEAFSFWGIDVPGTSSIQRGAAPPEGGTPQTTPPVTSAVQPGVRQFNPETGQIE